MRVCVTGHESMADVIDQPALDRLRLPVTGVLWRRLWHSPTANTWGSLAVRLSALVLVLPVVLVRFSPAEVALWQLFSTLFVLALMLDFGLAPTFARLLAFARGGASVAEMRVVVSRGAAPVRPVDSAAINKVMGTARWLYPRLAGGAVLLLALPGTFALLKPVSQAADPTSAWLAWSLVLATTAVSMWGGGYAAALQGMDKIALMRRWEVVTGLGQIATSVAVLFSGGQLLALVAAYQAWAVVSAIRNRWLLRNLHPELFGQEPQADPEVLAVMWPAAWRSGLGVLMSNGIIQASGVVYSQLAPAAEVAAYLLGLRVIMTISQICQAPYYSKLPRLAELQAAGQQGEQLRLAQRGMSFAYWVYAISAVIAAVATAPLLQWIGSRTPFVSPGLWALMALAFFAERFGAMHLQLYSLTNHIVWHIANGVTGMIMILIASTAYPSIGVYAFPLAMLLAYSGFYCVYSVTHTRKAFGLRLMAFESRTSMLPALALCAGLTVALMCLVRL